EARQRAAGARVQAVQQRAGTAHLRQRLARGVEDVAGTLQDDHERIPAGGRVGAGQPGPLRSMREVFLRRRRAAATRLQAARRQGMRLLVVSCYELGRQPVAAAGALAALEAAGFQPEVQDVSVERLSDDALRRAELLFSSVP